MAGQRAPKQCRRAPWRPGQGRPSSPVGVRVARLRLRRPRGSAGRWLSIFAASFRLFLIRFLVPVPVGQADNRDGPRLMRGLGGGKRADTVAMAGSNLATLLAFTLSIAPAASMGYRRRCPGTRPLF